MNIETFIKPNLMQNNSSYVITDPKGTLPKGTLPPEMENMFLKKGYRIKVLDKPKDMAQSNVFEVKSATTNIKQRGE